MSDDNDDNWGDELKELFSAPAQLEKKLGDVPLADKKDDKEAE